MQQVGMVVVKVQMGQTIHSLAVLHYAGGDRAADQAKKSTIFPSLRANRGGGILRGRIVHGPEFLPNPEGQAHHFSSTIGNCLHDPRGHRYSSAAPKTMAHEVLKPWE